VNQTTVAVTVNGRRYTRSVEPRCLLVDFLREHLGLTGTHVGCEHGICGACTVFLNGESVRSCLMFAVQADGANIVTVEGLGATGGELSVLQEAFWAHHGLQCGFCTPGMLITAAELLRQNPNPTEAEVRERIAGVLCRCTGYHHIIASVLAAARQLSTRPAGAAVPGSD
jgi:carbon-monoxide dehydrogenase small subunit